MLRVVAIGVLLFALTGCGTVRNFQREATSGATVYGGVTIAVDGFTPGSEMAATWLKYLWPVAAADVVLSTVGDTVTLPVTVPLAIVRGINAYYFPKDKPLEEWRGFWFNDPPSHLPPERVHGGIY